MANVSSFSGAMPVIPGGTVELGYVQRTTDVTSTATTVSAASNIFSSSLTFVSDGSPVMVEFFCPRWVNSATSFGRVHLVDGSGTELGQFTLLAGSSQEDVSPKYRYTPAAGVQTLNVRLSSYDGTTVTLACGAGGSGALFPMFLRVSKIIQPNNGLKPFWTPPVVTQLPSQATEGDQVLLYSSSPYAGYQTNQYATGSWRALNDSRGVDAWQSWTPTLAQGASTNITKTVLYAKYIQFGKTVNASVYLRAGAVGTAGSAITISLPVTAAASSSQPVGSAFYFQNVGTARSGTAAIVSSTTAGIVIDPGAGFNTPRFLGVNPAATVASNDFVLMTMVYEAA